MVGGGVQRTPPVAALKLIRRGQAQTKENEFLAELREELVRMAKPDLCNEAERLRLDTRGTKK